MRRQHARRHRRALDGQLPVAFGRTALRVGSLQLLSHRDPCGSRSPAALAVMTLLGPTASSQCKILGAELYTTKASSLRWCLCRRQKNVARGRGRGGGWLRDRARLRTCVVPAFFCIQRRRVVAFLLVVELLLHSPPDYPHSKFAWPWGFRFLVLLYSSFYGSRAQLLGSDTHGARGPSLTQTSLYMDVLVCGPLRRASCELDEASCRAHTPRGTSKAAERAIYK